METNKKIALLILIIISFILMFRDIFQSFKVFLFGFWIGCAMMLWFPNLTAKFNESASPISDIAIEDDKITLPLPENFL